MRSHLDLVLVRGDLRPACAGRVGPSPDLNAELVRLAVSRIGPGARVAFVGFDETGLRELPLTPIDCDEHRRGVLARIDETVPEAAWTSWADVLRAVIDVTAVDHAYRRLPYRADGHRLAFLLVSASPEPEGRVDWSKRPEGEACRLLSQRGWPVFTVATGAAARSTAATPLLRHLSGASGGASSIAATADEAIRTCAKVIDELGGRGCVPPVSDESVNRPGRRPRD